MSIQALREKRSKIANNIKELVDKNTGDKWNSDCDTKYHNLCAEIESVDKEIERTQKSLDLATQNSQAARKKADELGISDDEANNINNAEKGMFATWARGGDRALNEEQHRILTSRNLSVRNTMSTGTGSEGGFTVQKEFAKSISEAMASYGGMRQAAEVFRTATGAEMPYPTTDGRSEEGEIIGENQPASDEDISFGTKSLNTYKFSSKVITVPIELLQDSGYDIEKLIRSRIEQRLGRIGNRKFTVGTGTNEPLGMVTAAGVGRAAPAGQATKVTFDDLTHLEHSVDPVYREQGRCKYMFHDMTLKSLKLLKDTENRPIWLPGVETKEPDLINGYSYAINQHFAQMSANSKSIAFGDMSHYKIRDVLSMLLFRFADSAYTKKGQIGFLAWMRMGGNLMDVGGAVKVYQNSAT